jgi:phage/plasmid-like protein (TIGR03299 family)
MHNIEIRNGEAAFTYDVTRGNPWRQLGQPVRGLQTVDEALKRVGADFEAYKADLTAHGKLGPTLVEEKVAICADRPDSYGNLQTQVFGILGADYRIVQYRVAAEKALAVVEASNTQAVLDTMGLLFDGKRFFAYVILDELVIDPVGINDKIERGMAIYSSHDGSIAVTYALTDIRPVCANTITLAVQDAERIMRAKHTSRVDERLEKQEIQRVLGISTEWAAAFKAEAEKLLRVPHTNDRFDRVLKRVFPVPASATDRQKANASTIHDACRQLFENDTNAGAFGRSGWTQYNAIAQYLDHFRKVRDPLDRPVATITPGSWVEKRKLVAQQAILAG